MNLKWFPTRCREAGKRYYRDPGTWDWIKAYLWCRWCTTERWSPRLHEWLFQRWCRKNGLPEQAAD